MKYGLIGERLSHSFSPVIHLRFGTPDYILNEIPPESLGGFMKTRDFSGINVTMPYKRAVIEYLDFTDPEAAAVGAVNTVINRDGRLCGYNTDTGGFLALAKRLGTDMNGKRVIIAGSGGTSLTVAAAARKSGAKSVVRMSRTKSGDGIMTYERAYTECRDAEILINTTPCGMFPDACGTAADITAFPSLTDVIDVVFNPLRTELTVNASTHGIRACGGLYMLVAQAALAHELFTGNAVPEAELERVYNTLFSELENIVLIGMPSSGKSTVGRIIAEKLGRRFVDTDAAVESRAGVSIAELFAKSGEREFRRLEAEVIKDVSAQTGSVIATGGGAVLDEANVNALRRNGRLYFLDRDPSVLAPSPDRPLARDSEKILALYRDRYHIYISSADDIIVVENGETADSVAERIEKRACTRH